MHRTGALISGVVALLAATATGAQAQAQAQAPHLGGTVNQGPYVLPGEGVGPVTGQLPRILFTNGGLPVGVWAPVPPPYDARADRTGAADPLQNSMSEWPAPSPSG